MIGSDIWVGLACLKANPAVRRLPGEIQEKVKRHVEGLDCILVELDDVQLLESRMEIPDSPDELIEMRQTAHRQPNDTVFGTFHIWHQDEAN